MFLSTLRKADNIAFSLLKTVSAVQNDKRSTSSSNKIQQAQLKSNSSQQVTVEATKPPRNEKLNPKLIIFDKDGTLICFHKMWIPWATETASRIEKSIGQSISEDIYELLGFCSKTNRVGPGLLAESTMIQIGIEIEQMLISKGLGSPETFGIIHKSIRESGSKCTSLLEEIHNLQTLFKELKQKGAKVAICTADNRESTLKMLKHFGLEEEVDAIVCGDDAFSLPKPHPHNVLSICAQLGITPDKTVMVGDTQADVKMARIAGLSAGVGVLSGVGQQDHLEPHADILVEHVGYLPKVLFSRPENESSS